MTAYSGILNFFHYNIIMLFLPFSLSTPPPGLPICTLFQIHFFFFNWCVGVCTACSVHIMWYLDLCVSVFMVDKLVPLSWGRPFLRPHEIFPFLASLSTGTIPVQVMFKQSSSWDFMGIAFAVSKRHSFTANSLFFGLLNPPLSAVIPKPDVQDLYWRCVSWVGLSSSAFRWLVVFCNALHVLQREVPWWRVRIAVRSRSHSSPLTR